MSFHSTVLACPSASFSMTSACNCAIASGSRADVKYRICTVNTDYGLMMTYKYHYMLGWLLIESIQPIICCLPPHQTIDTNQNQNQSNSPPPSSLLNPSTQGASHDQRYVGYVDDVILLFSLRCNPRIRLQNADTA